MSPPGGAAARTGATSGEAGPRLRLAAFPEAPVQLVVGLGNPGAQYEPTRHNLGFLVLDRLAAGLRLRFRRDDEAWEAAAGEGPGGPVVLLRPLAFMNRSGPAVAAWARHAGWAVTGAPEPPEPEVEAPALPAVAALVRPLVICDDIALPLGTLRLRARGGAGGHRGLESLIEALGGEGFPRLRLGIAGPAGTPPPERWAEFVLAPFAPDERDRVEAIVDRAAAAVRDALARGPAAAGARFNGPLPEPD